MEINKFKKVIYNIIDNNNNAKIEFYDLDNENLDIVYNSLKFNKNIKELMIHINEKNINNSLLNILNNFDCLKVLMIEGCNKIDNLDLVIEALKINKSIQELYILDSNIQNLDLIVDALKSNESLLKLVLINNSINKLDLLINVLKTNNNLQELNLSYNNIENIELLIEALQFNNSLQRLILAENKINDNQLIKIERIADKKNIELII